MSKKKKYKKPSTRKPNSAYSLSRSNAIKSLPNIIFPKYELQKFEENPDRIEIINNEIIELSKNQLEEFNKLIEEINTILQNSDPYNVLTYYSFNKLSFQIGLGADKRMAKSFEQFHLELLQGLVLQQIEFKSETFNSEFVNLEDKILKLSTAFSNKRLSLLVNAKTQIEKNKIFLIERIRNSTLAVRNWAYPEQVINVTLEVLKEFERRKDVSPIYSNLILLIEEIVKAIEKKNNIFLKKLKNTFQEKNINDLFDKFVSNFPDCNTSRKDLSEVQKKFPDLKLEQAKNILDVKLFEISHLNLIFSISEILSLSNQELDAAQIEIIMDEMSLEFSDLSNYPTEHLFLNNPIWSKPFIKIKKGEYFFPIPSLLYHFALNWVENLIQKDKILKQKYETGRSIYLEKATVELFLKHFKNADIYSKVFWKDCDDIQQETDMIVLIDQYLFVIEIKSGKITDAAKRGAEKELKNVIKKLVVEPSFQSNKFVKRLEETNKKINVTINDSSFELDLTKAKNILRLSVSLESFGLVTSEISNEKENGILDGNVDITPTICITELETIFDMLETSGEKIHYLARRAEIQNHIAYVGDELDLLVFYLETGFNIGKEEFERKMVFQLTGRSYELDDYYVNNYYGNKYNIPKPRPGRTLWFDDFIKFLEQRNFTTWSQIAYTLLSVDFPTQIDIEKKVKKLFSTVKKDYLKERHMNHLVLITSTEKSKSLIVFYAFRKLEREQRNNNLKNIAIRHMSENNMNQCVAIGFDIDYVTKEHPYEMIAMFEQKDESKIQ